ncbi:hypothetical protein BGW38_008739, partial [Lunasporangiospora selenospora]
MANWKYIYRVSSRSTLETALAHLKACLQMRFANPLVVENLMPRMDPILNGPQRLGASTGSSKEILSKALRDFVPCEEQAPTLSGQP